MTLAATHKVHGARVTVVGAARSGLAAADLLCRAGARVFVTDSGPSTPTARASLDRCGVTYEFGGHTSTGLDADFVVTSPGVPPGSPILSGATARKIPIHSELEMASWFCPAPILGITGSNGKTTTTLLLGHVFARSGRRVWVAGNIGLPFSAIVGEVRPRDVVVLEVSSFQLEHTSTFRPKVAVLLNLTPDHLDRYGGDVERYAEAKFQMCKSMGSGDTVVFNQDDQRLQAFAQDLTHVDRRGFSLETRDASAFVSDETIHLRLSGQDEPLMQTEKLALKGRHNLYNSLAAAVAARVMEVRNDVVRESLATFEGVPHRLEDVREVHGIRYVNDSKATNINAVWYALESMRGPVILLAGGRDKGNDYAPLFPLISAKVKLLVAFGEAAPQIADALGNAPQQFARARDLEEAVEIASGGSVAGDVVLLSPACASFDQYDNYEQRGNAFKRLVNNI